MNKYRLRKQYTIEELNEWFNVIDIHNNELVAFGRLFDLIEYTIDNGYRMERI